MAELNVLNMEAVKEPKEEIVERINPQNIPPKGITQRNLGDNSVGVDQLQTDSVGSDQIQDNAVGTAQIASGTTLDSPILTTPTVNVGSDAQGDIYYRSAAGVFTRLAASTSGYFLKTQGAGTDPVWALPTVPFWVELGRASNSAQASISVSGFTGKKYLMVLGTYNPSTSMDINMRFNNDSGSNYSWRGDSSGGADTTGTSTSVIKLAEATTGVNVTMDGTIVNIASGEKIIISRNSGGTVGAANAPAKRNYNGKWANTTDLITRIDILASTGNLGAAELVILGSD